MNEDNTYYLTILNYNSCKVNNTSIDLFGKWQVENNILILEDKTNNNIYKYFYKDDFLLDIAYAKFHQLPLNEIIIELNFLKEIPEDFNHFLSQNGANFFLELVNNSNEIEKFKELQRKIINE